jgi:hypothetical protein
MRSPRVFAENLEVVAFSVLAADDDSVGFAEGFLGEDLVGVISEGADYLLQRVKLGGLGSGSNR